MTSLPPGVSTLWGLLEYAAKAHGGRVAFRDQGPQADPTAACTYAELRKRAIAVAARLRTEYGVEPGDRIAMLSRNRREFLIAYFAAAALGGLFVPWNTRLTATEHASVLTRSGARVLLVESCFEHIARELDVESGWPFEDLAAVEIAFDPTPAADLDDIAQIYFTSGTTGHPKGVMLTHRNVLEHAAMTVSELSLSSSDVWGHIAPMFHLADAWATFAITLVGGTHTFLREFSAQAALDAITTERITISNLVPTMLGAMVAEDSSTDTSSLRTILSGGAPIAPEIVGKIVERFRCEYVQTYGMTETSPFLTMSLLDDDLRALPKDEQLQWRAKTGRAVHGIELRVVDESGQQVAADEQSVGEIQVRGTTVTPGYWQDPAATRDAFTADGFFQTGDLALQDERGFVTIVDRKKDVILTGGETVYSTEVENRLYEHEAVLEAAVVGLPDPKWGERVVGFVVIKAGHATDGEALRAFCRAALAGYKTPKAVRIVSALPRTGSGKLEKRRLRSDFGGTGSAFSVER